MSEEVEQIWDRLVGEYADAKPDADLAPLWTELVAAVTEADAESVDEQVQGAAPHPAGPRAADDAVLDVMNGVSDIVVRLCADVVLYGDESEPAELVAEARRLNDRYCDFYDLIVERHPDVDFENGGSRDVKPQPQQSTGSGSGPWQHRTGTPVDSEALGGLVKRLVTSYSEQADVVTLEAMWRSAFGAASGCDAAVIQEVCEAARLPEAEVPELRAANEVAAGFEELFAAAVVRLFSPDSTGDGDLADEARRLVQRRDALFDLMEQLYPGMYDLD